MFSHLTERWRDRFNADFDVLLYDLTSTYFEVNASDLPEGDKRRHGYSCEKAAGLLATGDRHGRHDLGLPLRPTRFCPATPPTTRRCGRFRARSRNNTAKRGVSERWIAVCPPMRFSPKCAPATRPCNISWGTPKGRHNRLEKHLIEKPERRPRRQGTRDAPGRQLKWLWTRLGKFASMNVKREEMLMKLGAARSKAPTAWRVVHVVLDKDRAALSFSLNRQKLRIARRRRGATCCAPI